MLPGTYDISVYQGDTFSDIAMITIPNLTSYLGPADLSGATVSAQLRLRFDSEEPLAEFDIEVLDAVERQIRPTIAAEATKSITARKGVWDLQVAQGDWEKTILKGVVRFTREVTHQ